MSDTPAPTRRLWLTFMTGPGSEQDLRELVDPILRHIDGIVAVFHRPTDAGYDYLEANKKDGRIIVRDWVARHDHSANEILFAGVIQEGDLVLALDTLERCPVGFAAHIKDYWHPKVMVDRGIDCLYYYGKAYLFVYNEFMRYHGSPHWQLVGAQTAADLAQQFPDEQSIRVNVRPLKRKDPFHWVGHYLKYWVAYPAGSNHALLGLEKQIRPGGPNLQHLFGERDTRRLDFRREVKRRGFPLTVEGVRAMFEEAHIKGIDDVLKEHLNKEKTLNDAWRLWILKDETVVDDHLPSSMKVIE